MFRRGGPVLRRGGGTIPRVRPGSTTVEKRATADGLAFAEREWQSHPGLAVQIGTRRPGERSGGVPVREKPRFRARSSTTRAGPAGAARRATIRRPAPTGTPETPAARRWEAEHARVAARADPAVRPEKFHPEKVCPASPYCQSPCALHGPLQIGRATVARPQIPRGSPPAPDAPPGRRAFRPDAACHPSLAMPGTWPTETGPTARVARPGPRGSREPIPAA